MEKTFGNLYCATVKSRFAGWTNFTWLLKRKGGNYLIACADVSEQLATIEKLGGVSRVFLTDIHFAAKWHGEVAKHFGASLVCHESDKARVKQKCKFDRIEALGERTQLDKDFLAIHTPGHADGGLCYFWNDGKENCLFTGDFLAHTESGWSVFCGKAKHKVMAKSLTTAGELAVTKLCPGVSEGDPVSVSPHKPGEFKKLTQDVIKRCCS